MTESIRLLSEMVMIPLSICFFLYWVQLQVKVVVRCWCAVAVAVAEQRNEKCGKVRQERPPRPASTVEIFLRFRLCRLVEGLFKSNIFAI
jgi:hypothetical protein